MPSGFSGEFKELVRERTDLVALVRESVSLIPVAGGREFKGLCPFHDDHNPSMCVYPDRQTYRCWSCNEGGDCFSWTQKIEGVDFRGALESLALRAGLELPKQFRSGPSDSNDLRKRGFEALAWAARTLHRCLLQSPQGERARRYLAERGFQDETIQQFQIGYHPGGWSWLMDQAARQFTHAELAAAGLVAPKKSGSGFHDHFLFLDRVVFPIRDERGRTVAFGGRFLPGGAQEGAAKYINSSESQFFAKNRVLYGFDVARDAIRRSEAAIVMEGYTDCIQTWQHGVKHVVATLGTALTENHVRLLKRFARQVVLVFDGDAAGIGAAERSVEKFLAQDLDLRILTLPSGQDPADYFQTHTGDDFSSLVSQSPEAWEFSLRVLAERYGLTSVDGRERVLAEMLQLISQAPRLAGTAREDLILNRLAVRLGLTELRIRSLLQDVRSRRSAAAVDMPVDAPPHRTQPDQNTHSGNATHRLDREVRKPATAPSGQRASRDDIIETDLLEVLLAAPERFDEIRQEIGPDDFFNPRYRFLFETCLMLADTDLVPSFDNLLNTLEKPEDKRLAVWLDTQTRHKRVLQKLAGNAGEEVEHCLLRQALDNLKWRRLERSHERVKQQLAVQPEASPDSESQARELLRQSMEYHRKRATKKTSIKNL